jgi:hypothetical protein
VEELSKHCDPSKSLNCSSNTKGGENMDTTKWTINVIELHAEEILAIVRIIRKCIALSEKNVYWTVA